MVVQASPTGTRHEHKRAKQENREADYRWGPSVVTYTDVDGPDATSQLPSEALQPQCAAAAMMHGMSMTPASSYHGGCPTIAEHQEFTPFMQPPELTSMPQDVIVPNPENKIEANLWNLNVQRSAREPSPLASFYVIAIPWRVHTIQCTANVLQVSLQMTLAISIAIHPLRTSENCRSIARSSTSKQHAVVYGQKAFTLRSWMSKRRSNLGSLGMTEDLLRMKRIQPAWIQPVLSQGCPPAQQPAPYIPSQPASSSSASMVPVKPAPMIRNPSMASAPQNAPFPSMVGADPWAEAKMKQQRK